MLALAASKLGVSRRPFPIFPRRVSSRDLARSRPYAKKIRRSPTSGQIATIWTRADGQARCAASQSLANRRKGTQQPASVGGRSPPFRPPRPPPKPPRGHPTAPRLDFNADAVVGFLRGSPVSLRAPVLGVQMSLDEARAAPGRDAAPDQGRARLTNDLTNGRN